MKIQNPLETSAICLAVLYREAPLSAAGIVRAASRFSKSKLTIVEDDVRIALNQLVGSGFATRSKSRLNGSLLYTITSEGRVRLRSERRTVTWLYKLPVQKHTRNAKPIEKPTSAIVEEEGVIDNTDHGEND